VNRKGSEAEPVYENDVVLLVTYDLKGPSAQYAKLYELLTSQSSWSHYLPSTWLVLTRKTPEELAREMRPLTQTYDTFLVIRPDHEYFGWLPPQAWEWIGKHLPKKVRTPA
jgi:hypothetical protein